MMKSKELRVKAWNSLKGKYWMAFAVSIVLGLIASIGNSMITTSQNLINIVNAVEPSELDNTMLLGALVLTGTSLITCIIGTLISIFVGSPADIGLFNYYIKNTYSKPSFKEAFSGFRVKYGRNVGALLLMSIKTCLWTLLFIVPGIIKSYEYAIIPYILADDSEISTKDAFKKAKQMMTGNKWRLFKLNFSFFGWFLLCVLTFGLGTLFLMPYLNAANAEFYMELKNNQK